MNVITIGGVALPNPDGYKVDLNDVDSEASTRSQSAKFRRERIRSDIYTISLTWSLIKTIDFSTIKNAISEPTFEVTFFDPNTISFITRTFYPGSPRSGNLISVDEKSLANSLWTMSLNLIEC